MLFAYGVIHAQHVLRTANSNRRVPLIVTQVEAIARVVSVRRGVFPQHLVHRRINSRLRRIIGENVVSGDAVHIGRARAIANTRRVLASTRINQQRRILRDFLSANHQWSFRISDKIAEKAGERRRAIKIHRTEDLVHRIGEVHLLPLPASKKEGLVAPYRPTNFKPILVELNNRLRCALGIRIKFLSIQRSVAEELKGRTMKGICAGARGDGNVRARVPPFFRCRVRSGYLEFLDVIGVQAEDVVSWVRVGGFVGLNTVNGDVHRAGTRPIHIHRIAGALHHARFIDQQI